MASQFNERFERDQTDGNKDEDPTIKDEKRRQSDPMSRSIVLRDEIVTRPALFDNIIAAPMQVKKQGKNIPLYSE
jgi:hypothetical protein